MSSRPPRALEKVVSREAFVYCLKIFVVVRLALAVVAAAAVGLLPQNDPADVPGWPAPPLEPGISATVTAWERWDGLWYLRIADQGYSDGDGSAAFFPLYPLAVRALSTLLGGHPLAAALVLSNLAYLAGLVVFYRLGETEFSGEVARRSVLLLAVFPTAFFFLAPYTESLFLLLSALTLFAARQRRWAFAGVAGALAALTRAIGLTLVLPLAIEAIRALRESGRGFRAALGALGAAALVPLGTLSYLAYWERRSGDLFAPLRSQHGWLREFSPLYETFTKGTVEAFRWIGNYPGGYALVDWLLVVPLVVLAMWSVKKLPVAYSVYVGAGLVIPLSFIFESRPLMSVPRFALALFPLFWSLALFSERPHVQTALTAAFVGPLVLLTSLFACWYWIF